MFGGLVINDPMFVFTIKLDPTNELFIKVFNNSASEANEIVSNILAVLKKESFNQIELAFSYVDKTPEPILNNSALVYICDKINELSIESLGANLKKHDYSKYHINSAIRYPSGLVSIVLEKDTNCILDLYFFAPNIQPSNLQSYLRAQHIKIYGYDPEQQPIKIKIDRLNQLDPTATLEFPDDFLCSISFTIMINPVKLSTATNDHYRFERSTIFKWVVENNKHPYTQSTKSISDIQPDVELARRIEQHLDGLIAAKEQQALLTFTPKF